VGDCSQTCGRCLRIIGAFCRYLPPYAYCRDRAAAAVLFLPGAVPCTRLLLAAVPNYGPVTALLQCWNRIPRLFNCYANRLGGFICGTPDTLLGAVRVMFC
jgi:hypothetical protein